MVSSKVDLLLSLEQNPWQATFMKKNRVTAFFELKGLKKKTLSSVRSKLVLRADCYKGSVKLHVQRNLKSVVEPIKATITFCFDAQNKPTLDSVRTAGFFLSLSISL